MSNDIVAVTRHCPENHASVVLVAHTAFSKPPSHVVPSTNNKHIQTIGIKPLHVEGTVTLVLKVHMAGVSACYRQSICRMAVSHFHCTVIFFRFESAR